MRSAPIPSAGPRPSVRLALAVLATGALALGLHAWRYMPFICDDALISLRYAKRLIEGQGLTWNPGERVEGYSNLLWVLSTAGLGWLGVDLIAGVRLLGALGMLATLAAVCYAYPPASLSAAPVTGIALLFLALSSAFAVWTIGGMEQPFVAALLAWAVVLCFPRLEAPHVSFRQMQAPGLCLALLCLTRPDAPLFTAAAALAFVLVGGGRRAAFGNAIALATLPLLFAVGQLAFRLVYYGEWVPNTALVKLTPSARYALDGARYLATGALVISPMLVLAAASAVLSFRSAFQRERMTLLCVTAVAWMAYLVVIGGDIFPAWRHFVPLLVLLALMVAIGGEWVRRHVRPRAYAGIAAGSMLLLGAFFALQWRDPMTGWALTERWEWDGKIIGTMLKRAFGPSHALLAVDAAGALPYWSELAAVDMLGLNDHYLPRHPPRDRRTIGIGHDLGDGQYVLGRTPDLVVFGIATGGDRAFFRSAREMQEDPRFAGEYTLVSFEGTHPYRVTGLIWVRRYSERIGIRTVGGHIVVPGFLMNDGPGSVARLGQGGALVLPFSSDTPARLDALTLPSGRWRIDARAAGPPLKVKVSESVPPGTAKRGVLDSLLPAILDLADGAESHRVSVEVAPTMAGPAELQQLVLTRMPD